MSARSHAVSAVVISLCLLACGGTSDPGDVRTVGGTVQGLTATGLVLQLNGGRDLAVPAGATEFTFAAPLQEGRDYDVQVGTQPAGQTCTVNNGQGTVGSEAVRSIVVACASEVHHVGGVAAGLAAGESVVLELNGAEHTVSANGVYQFPNAIPYQASYAVTVRTPPPGASCSIANASGTMDHDDVGDVDVTCSLVLPAKPALAVTAGVKQLQFSWATAARATSYRFFESLDGATYVQRSGDLTGTSYAIDVSVHLHPWASARYRVDACNEHGCTPSTPTSAEQMLAAIGYFKASNTGAQDGFGSIALSADGNTMAVGAPYEDSNAKGIGGSQADNSATGAGAVYVFTRTGSTWSQQAYIKGSNTEAGDGFGGVVALSADGSTMAVGAMGEDSSARGVGGSQADNSMETSGAVYVFVRSGTTWSQQAYVKASNTDAYDAFGSELAISADGNTLVAAAFGEYSCATGINGSQSSNSCAAAGAAYVFTRSGTAWSQQAYIKASNTETRDYFGTEVALSGDGNTLAVGAYDEDSAETGVNGVQADNSAVDSGAVYVFTRSGTTWTQQAYVKASNTEAEDFFGQSLALSGDGNTLAVGAPREDSAATGIDGVQTDNSAIESGAVYVFTRSGTTWTQQAYVKAFNAEAADFFGTVALSADGNTMAVGAGQEDSGAVGVGGSGPDNSLVSSGAVYVFARSGGSWTQRAYVKASNTGASDNFGGVRLSGDGRTLAVQARNEDSSATGIGGSQADNSASNAGAVYLY